MKLALFYHSLVSDWNHGNAHFLRGVLGELRARGHDARVFEPRDAWSAVNLVADHGESALAAYDGGEMTRHLRAVLEHPALARELAARGRAAILARHTCGHRVDELMTLLDEI